MFKHELKKLGDKLINDDFEEYLRINFDQHLYDDVIIGYVDELLSICYATKNVIKTLQLSKENNLLKKIIIKEDCQYFDHPRFNEFNTRMTFNNHKYALVHINLVGKTYYIFLKFLDEHTEFALNVNTLNTLIKSYECIYEFNINNATIFCIYSKKPNFTGKCWDYSTQMPYEQGYDELNKERLRMFLSPSFLKQEYAKKTKHLEEVFERKLEGKTYLLLHTLDFQKDGIVIFTKKDITKDYKYSYAVSTILTFFEEIYYINIANDTTYMIYPYHETTYYSFKERIKKVLNEQLIHLDHLKDYQTFFDEEQMAKGLSDQLIYQKWNSQGYYQKRLALLKCIEKDQRGRCIKFILGIMPVNKTLYNAKNKTLERLNEAYSKVAKVNIDTGKCIYEVNKELTRSEGDAIKDIHELVELKVIYPDDVNKYLNFYNFEHLKQFFKEHHYGEYITSYRKLTNGYYTNTIARFIKDQDYEQNHQVVLYILNNVEMEVEPLNNYLIHDDLIKANELLQAQLTKQNTLIEEYKERLNDLSHDLRIPLQAILSIIDELKNSSHNERLLAQLNTSSMDILNMLNNYLYISKINEQNILSSDEDFNIKHLINDIINSLDSELKRKNLFVIISDDDLHTTCYKGKVKELRKIITNIISNVTKYGKDDGYLGITLENKLDKLIIKFTDTGIGMHDNFLKDAFNLYARENNLTTGFGIGLNIVDKLTKLIGGGIEIISKQMIGTTFILTFTFPPSTNEVIAMEKEDEFNLNILLVDDYDLNLITLKKELSKLKINVDICNNGQVALDTYLNCPPYTYDLILMDLRMPLMDGITCTSKIRNSNHLDAHDINIIALSGDALEDIEVLKRIGFNDVFIKPLIIKEIIPTFHRLALNKLK